MNIPITNDLSASQIGPIVSPVPVSDPEITRANFQNLVDQFSKDLAQTTGSKRSSKFLILQSAIKKAAIGGRISPEQEVMFLDIIKKRNEMSHEAVPIISQPDVTSITDLKTLTDEPAEFPTTAPTLADTEPDAATIDSFAIISNTPFVETELTQAAQLQSQLQDQLTQPGTTDTIQNRLQRIAEDNRRYAEMLATLQMVISPFMPLAPPIPFVFALNKNTPHVSPDSDPLVIQSITSAQSNLGKRAR